MIRTKLTLWNTVVFAVALTLIGLAIFYTTRINIYGAVDNDMLQRASFLERDWRRGPPGGHPDGPPDGPDHHGPERHGPGDEGPADRGRGPGSPDGGRRGPPDIAGIEELRKYDPIEARRLEFIAGLMRPRIIREDTDPFGPPPDQPFDPETLRLSMAGVRQFSVIEVEGHRVRVLSLPLMQGRRVTGVAQFASELDDVDSVVTRLRNTLLALLPMAVLGTALLGMWLTARALRPVKRIAAAAERIGESNLDERLPEEGNDEFAYLAGRFNIMIGRIAGAFERLTAAYEAQRRFVADASHELKTPLTAIKGRVGLAKAGEQSVKRYGEHMAAIDRAADNMAGIIQGLLFLARADEHKLDLKRLKGPLAPILAEAAAAAGPEGRFEIEVPPNLDVNADPALLSRALVNLLSNAHRHTPADKRIGVRAFREGDEVVIQVWDEGEGIPADHLSLIFNRFHRVDSSRDKMSGGTGLGLAIVKSIVEAHGGTIAVESRVDVGTTVTVRLASG